MRDNFRPNVRLTTNILMVIGTFAIAFNLFSIAGSLKNKDLCAKKFALTYLVETTQKDIDKFKRLMSKKIGIPVKAINSYCDYLKV